MVFHRIMAGLIGLCLLIFNVVNTRYQPFFLLAVYVLTVFLSWLEMMIKKHYFSAAFARQKTYSQRGERACFSLNLKNQYFMPVNHLKIWIKASHSNKMAEEVKEFRAVCEELSSTEMELSLPGEHCVIWRIELTKAVLYDMFKIFKRRLPERGAMELVILPSGGDFSGKEIGWLEQMFNEEEYRADKRGQDVSSVLDVREYRAGDKLNQIHWKLTGKMDQVMVKEWGQPLEQEILVFLDLSAPDTAEEQLLVRDKALERFFGLGQWLCKRQLAYKTGVYNREKDKLFYYDVADLAELRQVTEAILRLPFYEKNGKLLEAVRDYENNPQTQVLYVSEEEIRGLRNV